MFGLMMAGGDGGEVVSASKAFNAAVTKAVTAEEEEDAKREKALEGWREFPGAYTMHPRGGAEHFLPLLVCCGAGGGKGKGYVDGFHGVDIWSYYWE